MYCCSPPKTNELDQFFSEKSINTLPVFMQCATTTRERFNDPIFARQQPFEVYTNDKKDCKEVIHPNPSAFVSLMQKGFNKNIDLDSELKGINRYADKCYQNNYKLDPLSRDAETTTLKCHDNVFKTNQTQSYIKMQEGSIQDRNFIPNPCLNYNKSKSPNTHNFQKFALCQNTPLVSNKLEMYDFNLPNSDVKYPCQRIWSNFTKRSMYPSGYTSFDINKKYVTKDCSKNMLQQQSNPSIDKYFNTDLSCMAYSLTAEYGSLSGQCKMTGIPN